MHEALADFATAVAESPELAAVLRNPQLESSAKSAILADLAGDDELLFTHFLQVVAGKGRAGELEEIAKEFERLMAREERRLTVELTTARELTDEEANDIIGQIQEAARQSISDRRTSFDRRSAISNTTRPMKIAVSSFHMASNPPQ